MSTARAVNLNGKTLPLAGAEIQVGDRAPDFSALDHEFVPVAFSSLRGKIRVVLSVHSLDTPVCDLETRRFNEAAAALGDRVRVLVVSMDLPFAQKRWCGAAGVERVQTLSDHRAAAFGQAFGMLIPELRLLARAVFVVDADDIVRYVQIVPEIAQEPDYDAVLRAVRDLL